MDEFKELENMFTYHAPKDEQIYEFEAIRTQSLMLAKTIVGTCPECDERRESITRLSEVVMWANAAIARHS